eukprot:11213948-Lingulodinium_polyedra.AAC.1
MELDAGETGWYMTGVDTSMGRNRGLHSPSSMYCTTGMWKPTGARCCCCVQDGVVQKTLGIENVSWICLPETFIISKCVQNSLCDPS